jgi:hypothetical protein
MFFICLNCDSCRQATPRESALAIDRQKSIAASRDLISGDSIQVRPAGSRIVRGYQSRANLRRSQLVSCSGLDRRNLAPIRQLTQICAAQVGNRTDNFKFLRIRFLSSLGATIFRKNLRDRMNRLSALLFVLISGVAIAQTTGTLNPSLTPAEPSVKEDVPPGGCMPIGMTASGEMVFPIQCKEIIERERGRTVEQKAAISEEKATAKSEAPENSNPVIKPVETVPLPKRRDATSSDATYGCQHYRSYNRATKTYTDYDGRRRSCR